MPAKIFIKLKLEKEIDTKELTPDKIHGIFFSLIGEKLSQSLHEDFKGQKPYAIFCKELFQSIKTNTLNLEVSILYDPLISPILSEIILSRNKATLNLEKKIALEHSVNVREKWLKPYEILEKEVKISKKISIKFLKPTSFRRYTVDFIFPIPELLFKGLIKKWLAFSSIPIPVNLSEYYPFIEIEKYKLESYKITFSNGGKLTTFKGYTVFNFSKIAQEIALKWFNILLNYALWSGVGRKTTMGLGKISINALSSN